MLNLVKSGVGRTVAADYAVERKSARVGLIAEVAAVQPLVHAVFAAQYSLIRKVPDKAARQAVVLFEHIPVIGEIAQAVAHAVRVFAFDERQILIHIGRVPGTEYRP